MRIMNRFADGAKHQQALPGGQAPTVAVRVDWLSLDVFHDQKVDGVVVADIVEEANPRMVESRNGLRLSGELLSQVAALGESVCPHLDCDTPIQSRVPCAIDIAHSARGYPVAKGTRITVYDILEYLAAGMTEDEILSDFLDLTRDDIRASLAFAAARERRLANSVA
jgi:uncharacterized protein (DUF433 family)